MTPIYEKGSFLSKEDQTELFFQSWVSNPKEKRKNIIFVHGALEHSGRYKHLIQALSKNQINFFSFDLRGHGHSGGIKGDSPNFKTLISDLKNFIEFAEQKYQIKNPILVGHSLGGLISLSYCLENNSSPNLLAVYTSAPALSVNLTIPMRIKQILGKYLLNPLVPKLRLPVGLDLNYITHDKSELINYQNDPLVFDKMSIRFALEILSQGQKAIEDAHKIKEIPIFLAHGNEDGIAYHKGTEEFYSKLSIKNKKIMIYKNYYHELFNETIERRKQVFTDLISWCETQWKQ